MDSLAALTFVSLDGEPPAGLGLEPLPPAAEVCRIVCAAWAAFMPDARFESIDGTARPSPPEAGLHLIYVYGHAWLDYGGFAAAVSGAAGSVIERGATLCGRLLDPATAARAILILDCCHAGAFDLDVAQAPVAPRLTVYACGADESAIALAQDGATRLSLALARALGGKADSVDLARAVADVADALSPDTVIEGQTVTYRMNGPSLRLARCGAAGPGVRDRTVARIRNDLLILGAAVAAVLIAGGWFYWSHVLIDLDLNGLTASAKGALLVATVEDPAANGSRPFLSRALEGGRVRFWAPAADLILRVNADYADGAERALGFHLDLKRSVRPSDKLLHLALPAAAEVLAHPGMAYVPRSAWIHSRERQAQLNGAPFWIDIAPPTTAAYEPIAEHLLASGKLKPDNSFPLTARGRSAAIDAVGQGQVRTLNKDLGDIFGVIAAGSSQQVEAPGDIVVGAGKLPCSACPAVMTRLEAKVYCQSQAKRLPTDLEWELAVRGVDGRVSPWGDRFDGRRANVPGLPQKGAPSPALQPVLAYAKERSPFGLIDTVGNAGDWVTNASGSYERVYMGATYRYNPEDATAFRMLPVTDSDYLFQEITARCVAVK